MKRYCLALWICLTFNLAVLSGQDKTPAIVVDNPVKDFGKVMVGTKLKHEFRFSNRGSGTLEIVSVEATCGCQATSLTTKQVKPDQTGRIEVSIDTMVLMGPIEESVNIITNDPLRSSILLTVKADVQPEISLSSPSIYFGDVPRGKEITEEVIITIPEDKSIKILGAASSEESVSVRLESVPGSGGKKVKLMTTYKADGKKGYRLGDITVKTDSHLTPELTIHLVIRNFSR